MSVTHDLLGWNCALSNAGPDSGIERVQAIGNSTQDPRTSGNSSNNPRGHISQNIVSQDRPDGDGSSQMSGMIQRHAECTVALAALSWAPM